VPLEPPPTAWDLDLSRAQPGEDLVGVGADLEPGTVLAAYRGGMFPMGLGDDGAEPLGWWSPDPRGVLLPGAFHASRSLRRSAASMEVRVDTAFVDVVRACADPARRGRWITEPVLTAYTRLHELGWAHSVETWRDGELVGGLYGLAVGGLFAGESMFHRATDASKVAVRALTDLVFADSHPDRLVDVQWRTRHLATLGVVEVPRSEYLARLARALPLDLPAAFR
jgi:leucyl/phenylalanyl-tRNA--protein transferase